jgi:AcrR family transcriptional regulator
MAHRPATDRRTRRTRSALHGALTSLVHEKAYHDIVVKEILRRAGVARSTFYAHYRDKDDLLDDGMGDLLRAGQPAPSSRWSSATDRLLRFSRPFLEHVEGWRGDGSFGMDPRAAALLHARLRRVLERDLVVALRAERRRQPASGDAEVPDDLLARHLAATFVLTLDWWRVHPALSAGEVDARFRALVEPALRIVLAG